MKARIAPCVFGLALAWLSASAQTTSAPPSSPASPAKPAARETPPDVKVYNEVTRTNDPAKKIELLEKFKKDFPESSLKENASLAVLSTLAQWYPERRDRILKYAQSIYRAAPAGERGSTCNQIALQLLNAGVFLKEAEGYARKSVSAMAFKPWLKEQLAGYEKRKEKAPSSADLEKRFRSRLAPRTTTLGRIELRLGRDAEARKLLEEAYEANPNLREAQAALGELAAKSGDNQKALEYLVPARLAGSVSKSTIDALQAAYRATHNGSSDGLEALLDARYRELYPTPIRPERYKPSEKRTRRVVLAQVFTGAGCPPCVGVDVAIDAAMERYSRDELAVLMYHVHVPRPDPMTVRATQALYNSGEVPGVPTYYIDGDRHSGGGEREHADRTFEPMEKAIDAALEKSPEARLSAEAALAGDRVNVKAAVDGITGETKDLRLHIGLVQKEMRYSGENGIRFHPMVVRALAGDDGSGLPIAASPANLEYSFDLAKISADAKKYLDEYEAHGHRGDIFRFSEKKHEIDRGSLGVVVFVQNARSLDVLDAAWIDLGPSHPATAQVK